jgi:putative transposase
MYYTITRAGVHQHAYELLRGCLHVADFSAACTARVLFHVLFVACSRLCSLSAACFSLATAPSRETVRKGWMAWLPARDELLHRLNNALTVEIPRAVRKRAQQVAIDLVLIPYHGQPLLDLAEVFRSAAKDGTSHFHAYATAYVNYRGQRYTLALTTVECGEKLEEVIKRLLRQLSKLGIAIRMLLLDRGFWSVAVLRYLQVARKPFLMPVVLRGRTVEHPQGPSGTRVFAARKEGGFAEYTLTAADGRTARVRICVHCRNYDGQWDRHGRQTLVYAFWKIEPPSTAWVRETYRRRFAIETSYRQAHQARARTSTRNPVMRLLLVGVALVLRNVWVWLHYAVLSSPRRGAPSLNLDLLPFKDLLLWLQHQAEEELGWCDEILAERPLTPIATL